MSTTTSRDSRGLRMPALERANEVRLKRAAEHKALAHMPLPAARERLAGLLLDPPDWLRSAPIAGVLRWLPYYAGKRVDRLLHTVDEYPISPVKAVGHLSERQRNLIANRIRRGWARSGSWS